MTGANSVDLKSLLTKGGRRIHLIGVAGSGMSGIAGLLLSLGHKVSGSDKVDTVEVRRLQGFGLVFHSPHTAAAVTGVDAVVYSSAIKPGNAAYDEAVRLGIPLFRRAEALAAIMAARKGIIVAGMHGKTTTSSMAAHVLRGGGLHPSHYVGAEIPILGTNAHWDPTGEYFVAEGDESDGTIRLFHPWCSIILNIEEEHLDFYKDLDAIEAVFRQLMAQTSNLAVYCFDDPHARRICGDDPKAVSYGGGDGAVYQFRNLRSDAGRSRFEVHARGVLLGEALLNVPGRHNVSNAMAVVALGSELGIPFEKISAALETFRGAKRRFEVLHRTDEICVVDDYGHHPTEIKATLATAKATGAERVLVMFQPHRYTRTQALRKEFGVAFHDAAIALISDIYPASEKPIPGVTGDTIVTEARSQGHPDIRYHSDFATIHHPFGREWKTGDCVVSLGAGNIHEKARRLVSDLRHRDNLLERIGSGVVRLYEPMSKRTTMRVGGPAQIWVEPETERGFGEVARYCREESLPLTVIGRGSNLLVRDGGIRGVVVHLGRGDFVRIVTDGLEVRAGAGAKFKQLALAARAAGIGGFEWMEGIPGSVGGGLRMNAGAMGTETFDQVVSVRCVDPDGRLHEYVPSDFDVQYRDVSNLARSHAVSAVFRGIPGDSARIESLMNASMEKRRSSQPAASSAGCIFRNPAECPAGKLVDELGLKNSHVGAARVSEVHGNFIVNDGGASAADVLELIIRIQDEAKKERGITLQTEVQIIGEPEVVF